MYHKNTPLLTCSYFVLLLVHHSLSQNIISQLKQEINIIDLPEKSPAGTLVCDVRTLALTLAPDNKTKDNKHLLRFQIKTPIANGNGSKLLVGDFMLNETSGELVTKKRLDRDELCQGLQECLIQLDVQVTPIEYYQLIHIAVKLVDLNDHTPTFPANSTALFLSSTPKKGQIYALPLAFDSDEGRNGTVRYRMEKMSNKSEALNEYFSLEMQSCDNNQSCPTLKLTTTLNTSSEKLPQIFLLTATDGGSPPLTGSTLVTIHFIQTPSEAWLGFERSSYHVDVSENREVGLVLIKVLAIRLSRYPSVAELMGITYSLVKEGQCSDAFKIDNATGVITTAIQLDFESFQSCSLVVMATLNLPSTTSIPVSMVTVANEAMATSVTCMVEIDVVNLNDNAPTIELLTSSLWVNAGSQEGILVARLLVRDLDDEAAGLNDTINCTIDSPLPRLLYLITSIPHHFEVLTSPSFSLHRFPSNVFHVNVFCSDSGGIITKLQLDINITRRAPRFGHGRMVFRLEITQLEPGRVRLGVLNITMGDSEGLVFTIIPDDVRLQGVVVVDPIEEMLYLNSSVKLRNIGVGTFGFNVTVADIVDSNLNDTMSLYVEIYRNEQTSSPSSTITFLYGSDLQNNNNKQMTSSTDFYTNRNSNNNNNNINYSDFTKPTPPLAGSTSNPSKTNIDNTIIIIVGIACGTVIIIIIVIAIVVAMVICSRRSSRKRRADQAPPIMNNITPPPSDDVVSYPIRGKMGKSLKNPDSFRSVDGGGMVTSGGGITPANNQATRDEESLESEGADSGKGQSCTLDDVHYSSGSNIAGDFLHKYCVYPPVSPPSNQSFPHEHNHLGSDHSIHLSLHPPIHNSSSIHPPIQYPPSSSIHGSFPSSRKYRSRIKVGTGLRSLYNAPTLNPPYKVASGSTNGQSDYLDSRPIPHQRSFTSTTSPIYTEPYKELYREPVLSNRKSSLSSPSYGSGNFYNYNHDRNLLEKPVKDSYV